MKKTVCLLICLLPVLLVFSRRKGEGLMEGEKIKNAEPALLKGTVRDSLPWTVYQDLGYGDDGLQKMDVYLPSPRNSKTRMIIIIHGGGWFQGDKSEFDSYVAEFKKRLPGYAIANLNYRLVIKNGNYFPTQENDIVRAIKFLKNKASDYNISTDYILFGMSAGAHLALLQGYKHADVTGPKGIISFFGAADLQQLYRNSDSAVAANLKTSMNATPEGNPAKYAESSPVNFVTAHSAPTLMLHGDQDKLIPIEQAYLLRDKLAGAGVINKLVVYPGQGHGWTGEELSNSYQEIAEFIKGLEN
jgi:acetyl esterase/lipase